MSETHHPQPGSPDPNIGARRRMVEEQIAGRQVSLPAVLEAMRAVPRHLFVPPAQVPSAYSDSALPIGHGQTISQPYIVGLMSELLQPRPGDKILEIGTGSGYQAAVLAQIGAEVYTIEIIEPLAARARDTLARLEYGSRVSVKAGDGFAGWPEHAPFDSIIVTCAVSRVPSPLLAQLKPGGRIVLPLGETLEYQTLTVVTKSEGGELTYRNVIGVVFVPMTGPHGFE
ncbi:protein-L-isoaspartate(D-aspartate) O-methyltransferase [candidate division FCPU426 bacterium]|nr:protein-L-isoaspartate(D-aspartate) O-methyltransferase [candidate division FCPU426 bacterium]